MQELLDVGMYDTLIPKKSMKVSDLIKELGLEGNMFGVLVDGKRVDLDTVINEESKIIIIPFIAGG